MILVGAVQPAAPSLVRNIAKTYLLPPPPKKTNASLESHTQTAPTDSALYVLTCTQYIERAFIAAEKKIQASAVSEK